MIHLTQGCPAAGMTYPRTLPVENSEPSGATDGNDGQGVCTTTLVLKDAAASVRLVTCYADALSHMEKALRRQRDTSKPGWDAYFWAAQALGDQVRSQVRFVRDLGLLLHVGCAV